MDRILAIRVFKGDSTSDIFAHDCKFLRTGLCKVTGEEDNLGVIIEQRIPGIWYMLDPEKSVIPILTSAIFVPMTAIVQIAYELPF